LNGTVSGDVQLASQSHTDMRVSLEFPPGGNEVQRGRPPARLVGSFGHIDRSFYHNFVLTSNSFALPDSY
jgi:hypothetical protein